MLHSILTLILLFVLHLLHFFSLKFFIFYQANESWVPLDSRKTSHGDAENDSEEEEDDIFSMASPWEK